MAVNLSALSTVTTEAITLSNLILVNPQKDLGIQPQPSDPSVDATEEKFLFHYEGENQVLLESDITDHYTESNTALQDQISLKPEMIITHGFIGELNDIAPEALAPLLLAVEKLTVLQAYLPEATIAARIAYNAAVQASAVAGLAKAAGVSAWNSLGSVGIGAGDPDEINSVGLSGGRVFSIGVQNKQQVAFQKFYGYWRARTLFTVQTPWAIFKDCAIKSLRAVQDAETRMISDFEVSFKALRFADTSSTSTDNKQGRLSAAASSVVNVGQYSAVPATTPTMTSLLAGF